MERAAQVVQLVGQEPAQGGVEAAGPDLNVPSAVRLGFPDWMVTAHLLGLPEATQPLSHLGPRFPLLDSDQIVFVGGVDRLLIHFDVDVVDFIDFPAADFPTINAGLTLTAALECIQQFVRHPKFAALTVCEFNPDHVDEEHELVRSFVEQLAATFSSS